jgi:arylsulfatase A-like enzyme
MVTDHYHYLETGGENYCQQFNTWECFRGQEFDPWVSRIQNPVEPEFIGKFSNQYQLNRTQFKQEADYPTPKTFQAAAEWLENNKESDDFLLWVETFDPHEPFDMPQEYLELYGDDYQGPLYNWPEYGPVNVSDEALKHIRKRYAASLTMTDRWLGQLLDVMDRNHLWEDTLVIFTTDHGYILGEHGFMAKNYMPAYNEIFNIPLMVHLPGSEHAGKRINTLTQNIDLLPTLLSYFNIDRTSCKNKIHGLSWEPLLSGVKEQIRDYVIYGYFAKNVNITDGCYSYFRAATDSGNNPIYLYTAMPTTLYHYFGLENMSDLSRIELGRFLKWTDFPVFKIPADMIKLKDRTQAFDTIGAHIREHQLFDLRADYLQNTPLHNKALEAKYLQMLRKAMTEHDSPDEQFIRLGIPMT